MAWKRSASVALEKYAGLRVTRTRPTADGQPDGPAAMVAAASPPKIPAATDKRPAEAPPRKMDGLGKVGASARPPAKEGDRLLKAPVFVLSGPRSGSTLLRVVLNSHSKLHSPIETHVRRLAVKMTTAPTEQAMEELGHNLADIEHLLWDRILHRELQLSGKETVVEKTPSNVFVWKRLSICWPDARFIFLMRHPASIARSWHEGDPDKRPMEHAIVHTLKYMRALEVARQELGGLTLRYEDLTDNPEAETRRICEFLDIPWEEQMITYGQQDHGEFRKGIGDWKEKIRTGTIQRGRPLPTADEIPEELREMCRIWGYLPAGTETVTGTDADTAP